MDSIAGRSSFLRIFRCFALVGVLAVLVALTSGCETQELVVPPSHAATLYIQQSEFGEQWPFTVSEGTLECVDYAVIFHARSGRYGLNGLAISKGYAEVDPIRRTDPRQRDMAEKAKQLSGPTARVLRQATSIDLGPVLTKGLGLCD